MKKRLLVLLTLLMLLTSFLSIAYADVDKEIVFRGIPWGTSATEFLALIQKDNLGGNLYDNYPLYSWEHGEKRNLDDPVCSLKDAGYKYYTFPDATVAGIPIYQIEAYFTYTYDEHYLYKAPEQSSLYLAEYSLKPVDIGMAYPVLKDKMTALYGAGKEDSATVNVTNLGGNDYTRYIETVTWYGSNDTAVRLFMQYHVDKVDGSTEYKYLTLSYGKSNSVDLLSNLKKALAKDEMNQVLNNDSTDGL